MTRVVILGGGPGGYEAALVAAQLGADVRVVDRDGLGGSAVLTDCVPSKTLVATAEVITQVRESGELGLRIGRAKPDSGGVTVDVAKVNARVKDLVHAQSGDVRQQLQREGIQVLPGTGLLDGPDRVAVTTGDGRTELLDADVVLVATGAHPRVLPDAQPDGERILTWEQVYDLDTLPDRLVVVGSGVTGLEFAGAYNALGCDVVLVSSRDRVLPSEDADAATLIEDVYKRRGMTVLSRSRAAKVTRTGDGVVVTLTDGRVVEASHCLLAVGSVPNTDGIGLDKAGVALDERGFIEV
ncbi:MAG TPA: FAD-dependent oxidoreductase, partial [Actinopolymorphaceae bacterium]|nr:FAD-dependent oxidoreductase [Actinopolymorphaceae bacterium]